MSFDITEIDCRVHCPAKLNLTLAVAPPRPDGLHPIASVMVALDFTDTLLITPVDGPTHFERAWAHDAPRPSEIDWPIEKDLIYRAHALMEQEAGRPLAIECELVKRIPAGAGLGGGSSNAAGMLVGLCVMFRLDISEERLIALGQSLGADVGFLVAAQLVRPAAVVTGIGQVLSPLASLPPFDVVLVFPDGACPTAEVYRAFDAGHGSPTPTDELSHLAQQWQASAVLPEPMNDLAPAAIAVCPVIERAIATLKALDYTPHLTGSGSALFVLANDAAHARQIADQTRQAGLHACATRF